MRQALSVTCRVTARSECPLSGFSTYMSLCHSTVLWSLPLCHISAVCQTATTNPLPSRREAEIPPEMHVVQVFERKVGKKFHQKCSGGWLIPSLGGLQCSWLVGPHSSIWLQLLLWLRTRTDCWLSHCFSQMFFKRNKGFFHALTKNRSYCNFKAFVNTR